MHPLVSIIIPTFNHAAYLPDAINSVLGQTYRDVEIIVVDDGSTDDTRQVAAGYGDAIRYIYQANRGLSATRNAGIGIASGQLIGLLDADDFYGPQYLETMASILDAESHLSAAYCGFQFVDCAKQPTYQRSSQSVSSEQLYQTLLKGNFLAAHCVLVRRTIFERLGMFDESLSACEDWDMWLRMAKASTVKGVDEILAYYRLTEGSMSRDPIGMLNNRLQVLGKHLGPSTPGAAGEKRHPYARAYLVTAIEYLQSRREDRVLECLQKAMELYPPLLGEMETFYELALWDQPKGWRGDLRRIDPAMDAAKLFDLLDRLFESPGTDKNVLAWRNKAYVLAYEALGRFSYGRREMAQARRFFISSAARDPRQLANRQFMTFFARSLLGQRVITLAV